MALEIVLLKASDCHSYDEVQVPQLPYLAIDFEASCLPARGRSYPIEVGISDNRGNARSWLIRPDAAWADWCWTEEAERLHGLSREDLFASGQPAAQVLAELNAQIGHAQAIADSDLDARWLQTLAQAAGIAPQFRITHLSEILDPLMPSRAAVRIADEQAAKIGTLRHRAAQDARYLATWLDALHRAMAGHDRLEYGSGALLPPASPGQLLPA